MLGDVAVVVFDGVSPFEFASVCESFAVDRTDDGVPALEFGVCAVRPGTVTTQVPGLRLDVDAGLERLESADLIAVPAIPPQFAPPPEVIEALRAAYDRGTRLLSICSGAFVLGAAGLLDGRECTTHWRHSAALAARFPLARVVPEVLYVDTGQIITSAGTAAGLDACLHIWRQEYGAAIASAVARRMVVPPQRDGGQAQYIARAVPECATDTFAPLLLWIEEHLAEDLSVETLARHAHMSPRTFARRFRDETGTTPHAWITSMRVRVAEEHLERSDLTVEAIAARVGFGTAAALRQHFVRARGVSPQAYRRQFAC